jgi:hypothetical protein
MGERERPRGASQRGESQGRKHWDRYIQDPSDQLSLGTAPADKEERVLLSRAEAEVYAKEQPAPENNLAPSNDIQEYKSIKEQNRILIEKNERLVAQNHELWAENDRLNDALKEFQELKEKEERRKELQRQRAAKWRKEHPETHRARAHKTRRDPRSDEEQQGESA